jgi:hypothetical protein
MATLKKWEEAWTRLIKAQEKLQSYERDHAIVRHILILDNTKPGDTISLESGFAEQRPPSEVLKALAAKEVAISPVAVLLCKSAVSARPCAFPTARVPRHPQDRAMLKWRIWLRSTSARAALNSRDA